MEKKLLILGAGYYSSVVYDIASASGLYKEIAFLDDSVTVGTIGKLSDCEQLVSTYNCAIVAIGNVEARKYWLGKLIDIGFEIPILVHPSAVISHSATIGVGTIVEPMATVQAKATIGKGCLICSGSVLKHNASVEDWCYIDCNSTVMPETKVTSGTRLNSNTVFFQRD